MPGSTPPRRPPDGNYAITAEAIDIAGNVSPVSARSTRRSRRSIRRSSPESAWSPPSSGLLGLLGLGQSQQSLSIVGTAPPNDSVQVYLGGDLAGHDKRRRAGELELQLRPFVVHGPERNLRLLGNRRRTARATSVRRRLTFQLQVGGGPTASTPQYASGMLSGQATPGSLVTIVDGNVILGVVTADSSGNWQFTPTLSKGKHSIMAEATSSAGYTSLLSGVLNVKA